MLYGGIDFGGTNLKAVVTNEVGLVVEQDSTSSNAHLGPAATLERLIDFSRRVFSKHNVSSIGLAACGPVDSDRGILYESPVLPGWPDVEIGGQLSMGLGVPVTVENDSNCAIFGEWWAGSAKAHPVVAGFTLGTGIGGGLILNGEIYRGADGVASEFGHLPLEVEPACPCGGAGCLEVLASSIATLQRYSDFGGPKVDGMEELVARSVGGDEVARHALSVSVDYLARAVRGLINVVNPSVFILAGGWSMWGDPLVEELQSKLFNSTFPMTHRTPIRQASLGLFSGAVGAAGLGARRPGCA